MIFDASSIYRAIELNAIEKLANEKTVNLCFYELGNAIWKQIMKKNISLEEGIELVKTLSKILSLMDVLPLDLNLVVLKISEKYNLSYYDASYLYAAHKFNDAIVSEDEKLLKIAKKYKIKWYKIGDLI
ncbi:MAG: type II toxin-antitoxin system VapC family toxin [Candidatus Thermoplasmatota archaeon]